MQSKINNVFQKFDFKGRSGFLQYWELGISVHNETVLRVAGQVFRSNNKNRGLENYRKMCLEYISSIGPDTKVDQEWFAGLAAQARISDQRTRRALDQFMGQLVMPVFSNNGGNEILGVIEFVTASPKASYDKYFNQIHKLLMDENLATKPMAKIIKVQYKDDIIKFSLPLTSGITYLWEEVTGRLGKVNQVFTTLDVANQNAFRIMSDRTGNSFQILSDDDLRYCIADSSSRGMMTIRMSIKE